LCTQTAAADNGNGDIFLTPTGGTATYANGVEIVDRTGRPIWFHSIPAGQTATDFRTQTLDGRPVLTWWQGVGAGGVGNGADHIYDTSYRELATVTAGNGYQADAHEFLLTLQGKALITIYAQRTADLTAIGGRPDQTVIDGLVQEIDVHTGRVLFQWDSHGTIPFSDSHQPLPASSSTPWDWFHVNAAHIDRDGNLLIDARNTWTVYKVNRTTGALIWELGARAARSRRRRRPGRSSTAPARCSPFSTTPRRWARTATRYSTTSRRARRCSRTAGRSRCNSTRTRAPRRW
jgi:Arylsulfotransferase (ASST)